MDIALDTAVVVDTEVEDAEECAVRLHRPEEDTAEANTAEVAEEEFAMEAKAEVEATVEAKEFAMEVNT